MGEKQMNKFIGIGRITKDLDLRKTPNGASVLNFTLAVNRNGKKQEGQPTADFIQCQAWNQTADLMYQYLGKGSLIGVEGRIQTRNYDGKDGKKVYITEVVVDRVEFLESRKNEDDYEQQSNEIHRQAPELNIDSSDLPF